MLRWNPGGFSRIFLGFSVSFSSDIIYKNIYRCDILCITAVKTMELVAPVMLCCWYRFHPVCWYLFNILQCLHRCAYKITGVHSGLLYIASVCSRPMAVMKAAMDGGQFSCTYFNILMKFIAKRWRCIYWFQWCVKRTSCMKKITVSLV